MTLQDIIAALSQAQQQIDAQAAQVASLTAQIADLQAKLAAQQPAPTPTPDPVPAPAPLIPVLGTERMHVHQGWLADYATADALAPRALPWTVPFADPNARILALPKNGVEPKRVVAYHHCGNMTELYSEVPYFDKSGRSNPYNSIINDDLHYVVPDLLNRQPNAGPRGICMPISYVSLISHPAVFPAGSPSAGQPIPRAPLWVMVRHDAEVQLWERDGAVTNHGRIPTVTHSWDVCVDPNNRKIMYVCTADDAGRDPVSGTGLWSNCRVVKVDRATGAGTADAPEDASKYVVTTYQSLANPPTSVRMDEAGNIYVACNLDGVIYKNGQSWVTLPKVFAMDYAAGKLYTICSDGNVHIIDTATAAVGPNVMPASGMGDAGWANDWFTISVDKNGTFGTVGNFAVGRVHSNGNQNTWQFSPDGKTVAFDYAIYHSGSNWVNVGDAGVVHELFGHYNWIGGKYHDFEAVRAVGGYTNTPIGLIVADPPIPAQDSVDYTLIWHGMRALGRGGPDDSRKKPSLTCFVTREGWSPFKGCSADEIAEMPTFDAMEAFIRQGMIGQFRRDDYTSLDIIGMLEMFCRNSQRHLREGAAFTKALRAWYVAKYGTPPVPAATVTPYWNYDAEWAAGKEPQQFLEARRKADGTYRIAVFWLHGIGDTRYLEGPGVEMNVAVPADAVIVADAGLPTETTDLTTLTPGQHALTVRSASMPTRATVVIV